MYTHGSRISHTHDSHTPCLFALTRQAFIYFAFLVDLVITHRLICHAHCNSVSSILNYSTAPAFRSGSKHVINSIQPSYNYRDSALLSWFPYKALLVYICIFFMRAVYLYNIFILMTYGRSNYPLLAETYLPHRSDTPNLLLPSTTLNISSV